MALHEPGGVVGLRALRWLALLLAALPLACDRPIVEDIPPHPLNVSIESSGAGFDIDGYVLTVDDQPPVNVAAESFRRFEDLAGSSHLVTLSDVADNCVVEGDNPRRVDASAGSEPAVKFQVECSVSLDATIAFTDAGSTLPPFHSLAILELPAAVVTSLGVPGTDPSWSRDGRWLAYAREDCSDGYDYPQDCTVLGISVMGFPRSLPVVLTSNADSDPSWSPDGTAIMFERQGAGGSHEGLYTINIDGTGKKRIPLPLEVSEAWNPAWSPDGGRLAFGCMIDGLVYLCIASIDGTDLLTLYSDEWVSEPAWSPDGSRIAFVILEADSSGGRWNHIAVVNVDGTGFTILNAGMDPVWSAHGDRLLFHSDVSGWPQPNTSELWNGLWTVRPDGTGLIAITDAFYHHTPAWRP